MNRRPQSKLLLAAWPSAAHVAERRWTATLPQPHTVHRRHSPASLRSVLKLPGKPLSTSARTLAIAVVLVVSSCSKTSPPVVLNGIVIEHATLISPEREEPLKNVDVVIRDGRIVAVGPNLGATAGARRIDVRGRYLIPGLIDTHTHVGNPMALDEGAIEKHPELLTAYRAQVPRAYLAFGFTTVVDVDSRPADRAWFEASPLHPRLYHCGRALRIAGGYGAQRIPADAAPRKTSPHLVYEPAQAANWPATLDTGGSQSRAGRAARGRGRRHVRQDLRRIRLRHVRLAGSTSRDAGCAARGIEAAWPDFHRARDERRRLARGHRCAGRRDRTRALALAWPATGCQSYRNRYGR